MSEESKESIKKVIEEQENQDNSIISEKINLTNGLLLFYVAIAGNYLGGLFSSRLRHLLIASKPMKHMMAYITMLLPVSHFAGIKGVANILIVTSLLYIWFVLTTKMFESYNILIILLLIIPFILNKHEETLNPKDPKDQKKIRLMNKISNFVLILTIVVTFVGVVSFMHHQRKVHGSEFSYYEFFIH